MSIAGYLDICMVVKLHAKPKPSCDIADADAGPRLNRIARHTRSFFNVLHLCPISTSLMLLRKINKCLKADPIPLAHSFAFDVFQVVTKPSDCNKTRIHIFRGKHRSLPLFIWKYSNFINTNKVQSYISVELKGLNLISWWVVKIYHIVKCDWMGWYPFDLYTNSKGP